MKSEDIHSITFLPGSADGPSRSAWLTGQTIAPAGPAPVRVSRFRAQDSGVAMPTSATSGPLFTHSSPSASLQWSLASRLAERWDLSGSPECVLTWSTQDMPAGVPICRLVASARRTVGSDYGLWPTPCVPNGGRTPKGGTMTLTGQTLDGKKRQVDTAWVARALWATPGRWQEGRAAPEPSGAFWADGEWLTGSDGKARRAQSGVCLLAHGIPARAPKLRAYGNSIVPQVAAAFITAYMEVAPDHGCEERTSTC
jgi:hypothetical protein